MARAVLDTSVLVSAFLTPQGPPGRVLDAAEDGAFLLCLSPAIVEETRHVLLREPKLRKRYAYTEAHVAALSEGLLAAAELVSELPDLSGTVPLDPKGDMIVATAVASGAAWLVTGDRRHLLALGRYGDVRIVTPRAFLEELGLEKLG